MKPEKTLVVRKQSGYDYYRQSLSKYIQFLTLRDDKQQGLITSHETQQEFFTNLIGEMDRHDLSYDVIDEHQLHTIVPEKYTLIMTSGGDGTFLKVAQLFPKILLFGLNSDYRGGRSKGSLGALTQAHRGNLVERIERLSQGDFDEEQWKCLYASVNGKVVEKRAINEIYFGHPSAFGSSNYDIEWDGRMENIQGSSGLLVTTGMGSNAWYRNAGGTPFSNSLDSFGFLVRDPNLKREPEYTRGIVSGKETIKVIPLRDGYTLGYDCQPTDISLKTDDVVEFGLSDTLPVRVVKFT